MKFKRKMDIITNYIKRQQLLIKQNDNYDKYKDKMPNMKPGIKQHNDYILESIQLCTDLKSKSDISKSILHFMLLRSIKSTFNLVKIRYEGKGKVWYINEYILYIEQGNNSRDEFIIRGKTITECVNIFWCEKLNQVYSNQYYTYNYKGAYIKDNTYQPGDVVSYNNLVYYATRNTILFPSHTCDMYDWDLL